MRSKGGKRQTKTSQQVRALSLCLPYASQVFSLRIDAFLPCFLVYRRQEASSRRKRDTRSGRGSDGLNDDVKSFASSSLTAPPPRPLSPSLSWVVNPPRYRSPMHIYPAAAREQPFIPIHSISRILLSLSPARRALLDEVFPTSSRSSPPLSGGGLLGGPTYRLSFLLSRTSSSLLPSSSSWTRRRTNGASLTYLRPQHQALRHRRSPATRSRQAGKRATRSVEQLTLNVRSGFVVEFRCLDLVCALGLKYTRIHIPLCLCHDLFPFVRERVHQNPPLRLLELPARCINPYGCLSCSAKLTTTVGTAS